MRMGGLIRRSLCAQPLPQENNKPMNFMQSITDLDVAVEELEILLSVAPEERNARWAYNVCVLSRHVHINVWDDCPRPEIVEGIIELLNSALDEIGKLDVKVYSQHDKEEVDVHIRNIRRRIKNLKDNYLKGKPSDFRPDARHP